MNPPVRSGVFDYILSLCHVAKHWQKLSTRTQRPQQRFVLRTSLGNLGGIAGWRFCCCLPGACRRRRVLTSVTPESPAIFEPSSRRDEKSDAVGALAPGARYRSADRTAIVTKLYDAFRTVESRSEIRERLIFLGLAPQTSPPPSTLQAFIDDEMLRWGKVVRAAGVAETE
jgi:hypothetical protein